MIRFYACVIMVVLTGQCENLIVSFFTSLFTKDKCPRGQYSVYAINYGRCSYCLPGTVGPFLHADRCVSCSFGYYQPERGQSSCEKCQDGFSTSSIGSKSEDNCKPCEPGYYSNKRVPVCRACGKGHYASEKGSSSCRKCKPDTYTEGSTSSQCTPCGPGQITQTNGSTSIDQCFDRAKITYDCNTLNPCVPTLAVLGQKLYAHADPNKYVRCSKYTGYQLLFNQITGGPAGDYFCLNQNCYGSSVFVPSEHWCIEL